MKGKEKPERRKKVGCRVSSKLADCMIWGEGRGKCFAGFRADAHIAVSSGMSVDWVKMKPGRF